jgi:hypothetical protein
MVMVPGMGKRTRATRRQCRADLPVTRPLTGTDVERVQLDSIETLTDAALESGYRGPEVLGLIREDIDARFRATWAAMGRPGTFAEFCADVMAQ